MEKNYTIGHMEEEGTPYISSIVSEDVVYLDNCSQCGRIRFNENNHDLSLVIDGENKLPDFLFCGEFPLNIVSNRVIDVWDKYNLTGYDAFPIKFLYDTNMNEIISDVKYFDIRITNSVELDFNNMGVKIVSQCSMCNVVEYDKQTWEFGKALIIDSSYRNFDLFTIKYFQNTLSCSKNVLNITYKERLTNFSFKPFESSFDPFYDIDDSFLETFESVSITIDENEPSTTFNWDNPECETTYGTTFTEHGSHHEVTNMMIKAREQGYQLGQWTDDKRAAEFIAKIAKERGVGVHDVPLPRTVLERFPSVVYLSTGMKHYADKARIIVNEDGSVKTAYPFSSAYPF